MTHLGQSGFVYCGSPAAIAAAVGGYLRGAGHLADTSGLTDALIAAHNPDLGLERSVCLRDVLEVLRGAGSPQYAGTYADAAELIATEFDKRAPHA